MKGLVRNNFYMVDGSLKASCIFAFLSTIILIIATLNETVVIAPLLGGVFGGFGALAGTAAQKDAASKWNRFELTLPVSRKDVIKARYISFMLYNLIGLVFAAFNILVFYITAGYLPLERIGFGISFGLCFAILLQATLFPLTVIFGADKNESLLFIAVALSLGIYFAFSYLTTIFFSNVANINFIFRVGIILFSLIFFIISYFISVSVYMKKEV